MNKVLKLQRVGLITPTVVEYEGKVLATNHLDIEGTCNLWRVHFGFYPTEKVDIAMTKKQFSSIQQKTLSSVKSVYELFYERNFIPRVFEANEEHTEWGMYRNKELEKLEAENAELRETLCKMETVEKELRARFEKAVGLPVPLGTPVLKVWRNRVPTDDTRMDFVDMWEITTVSFKLEYYALWGKQYFHNTKEGRKAAEARLEELEGGGKERMKNRNCPNKDAYWDYVEGIDE